MKIAYFDCFSGISGDMIVASLLDCGINIDILNNEIKKLNIPNVNLELKKVDKKGISASKFDVKFPHEHVHRGLNDIKKIINESSLSDPVKLKSIKIFSRLANAEGKIHNKSPDEIHFHEVGALDAIVDIVSSVICLEILGIENIFASNITVGSGTVNCAHGTIPVPVPAVLELLKDIPISSSEINTEIVTPTGAAIISTLSQNFGSIPNMTLENTGYGAGSKELPLPNILRVLIGNVKIENNDLILEQIYKIETNIDDMNPQFYDFILKKLLDKGALDVFLTPINMKKNRPATLLTAMCYEEKFKEIVDIILKETTSIGVRFQKIERFKTQRKIEIIQTKYGEVRIKIAKIKGQIVSKTPEYEDLKKIANEKNIPLKKIYSEINKII